MGMTIHECPDVHIANHTSCPDMQECHLPHEFISLNMYKDGYF